MHAWESIQKTLDHIEAHIDEEIPVEELAGVAALSVFYYQRLFARLVKNPVREYIKLRRLARACDALRNKRRNLLDIALEFGFGGREVFTRAFKEAYGITPAQYRANPVGLMHIDKPDLSLNYITVDEGVPLTSEGIVLEYNRKTLREPVNFLGVKDFVRFQSGKMLGEKTGVADPDAVWDRFFGVLKDIPHAADARTTCVMYGDSPEGYASFFVGVESDAEDSRFASWQLPAREYIVCSFEAENFELLMASMGKVQRFTRQWLKKHGLRAGEFFPDIYYDNSSDATYYEMWLPFTTR